MAVCVGYNSKRVLNKKIRALEKRLPFENSYFLHFVISRSERFFLQFQLLS